MVVSIFPTPVESVARRHNQEKPCVAEGYVIQLPRSKYTAREREMLIGAGAPAEWFAEDWGIFGAGLGVGAAVFAAVSYFLNKAKDE